MHLRSFIECQKNEIIDPAYNSLFANVGEGFLQDNIRYIDKVPKAFLEASMHVKSLKKEIDYIGYAMKLYEIVSTLKIKDERNLRWGYKM